MMAMNLMGGFGSFGQKIIYENLLNLLKIIYWVIFLNQILFIQTSKMH